MHDPKIHQFRRVINFRLHFSFQSRASITSNDSPSGLFRFSHLSPLYPCLRLSLPPLLRDLREIETSVMMVDRIDFQVKWRTEDKREMKYEKWDASVGLTKAARKWEVGKSLCGWRPDLHHVAFTPSLLDIRETHKGSSYFYCGMMCVSVVLTGSQWMQTSIERAALNFLRCERRCSVPRDWLDWPHGDFGNNYRHYYSCQNI